MQHRYFGDVGDFGKYGLLRILCGLDNEQKLRLGIIWYLYLDETHNADGKHISYLQKHDRSFRDCDAQLYDSLRKLLLDDFGQIIESARHLSTAEMSDFIPVDTFFYNQPLAYSNGQSNSAKFNLRNQWFAGALEKTESADLVFLDPDNGIECASVSRISKKGPKYVYWDDINAFIDRGKNIVIYHHLNRTCSHQEQVENMLKIIRTKIGDSCEASAITFNRGTSRAYFVIANTHHKDILRQRLTTISSGLWNRHFLLHTKS